MIFQAVDDICYYIDIIEICYIDGVIQCMSDVIDIDEHHMNQ